MPTLSLTNSIAFSNLNDAERRFPLVRLWGTIGWVVASSAFAWFWLNTDDNVANTRRMGDALFMSGIISFAYALYALLLLPRTPPKKDVAHPLAFAKAFGLLKHPAFLIATLVALPIAMIHQTYFVRSAPFFESQIGVAKKHIGMVLGIGQASEILFLLVLGFLIKRLGYKWVLVLGTFAYAARFGIFAIGTPAPLIITSQILHGLCYGCFFAGSFLLVERLAPADIRHSAQTVFGIIILGLGPILSGPYNQLLDRYGHRVGDDLIANFPAIWWTQSAIAAVAMVVLLVIFPNVKPGKDEVRV
jgi:predicted MFS family arabinose efflux permease